ncbi:hypothetical protein MRI28_17535 [Nocardiopsis dassonvillei]|uniref:hypothetical protein n=1 Tax=Nocardiopsis dassonvillei TaxID=2014 RepID=UPI00200BF852|nr:hypothetical protein [Nocardiopsis dassonvillei]MCK9871419.1 hypothetical protein [Nocardiopsis dassonvillei]
MVHLLIEALRHRGRSLHRALFHRNEHTSDDGLGTLEVAIIALGLVTLAIALVATITTAVNSRLEGIQ